MADAAAPTATPTAPAAIAAPPAAATPATPEPAVTPAPSDAKPTAKQSDHQRVQAAAKLLEKAGSAKESAAPAPEAKTAEPKGAEAKPDPDEPHEVTNAEWKEIRTRARKLEKREEAITSKEQEYKVRDHAVAQANQRLLAFEQKVQLLKNDPRSFLDFVIKESGSDYVTFYEKLANAYIDTGKPESQLAATQKQLQALEQKLAEREQNAVAQQREAQQRHLAQSFLGAAATEAHPSTQLTLKRNGVETVMQDAVFVATSIAKKLGRPATDAEVATELDAQYEEYYKSIVASHPRLVAAQGGVAEEANLAAPNGVALQQGTVKPANAVAPKAPTTLTNGGSAVRTVSGAKLTATQRLAAAAELIPDLPRPRGV